MKIPAHDESRIRAAALKLLDALQDMEDRFGHVGGTQVDKARMAIHEALGFRFSNGQRIAPARALDLGRMELEDRLKAWPAAGGEDGLSSLYVGHLMDEALREIVRLKSHVRHYETRAAA